MLCPAIVLLLHRAAGLRYGYWWITHVVFATSDLKPPQNKLRSTNYGEIRHAATALLAAGDSAAAPLMRTSLHCSIRDQCTRLDLDPIESEPSDPDPMAQIRTYPFGRQFC